MDAKQKAKQLIELFEPLCLNVFSESLEPSLPRQKAAAIICVSEIISACEYNHVESWNTDYWEKVKEEINTL